MDGRPCQAGGCLTPPLLAHPPPPPAPPAGLWRPWIAAAWQTPAARLACRGGGGGASCPRHTERRQRGQPPLHPSKLHLVVMQPAYAATSSGGTPVPLPPTPSPACSCSLLVPPARCAQAAKVAMHPDSTSPCKQRACEVMAPPAGHTAYPPGGPAGGAEQEARDNSALATCLAACTAGRPLLITLHHLPPIPHRVYRPLAHNHRAIQAASMRRASGKTRLRLQGC